MTTATPVFHVHRCALCGDANPCAWSDCLLTDEVLAPHEDGGVILIAAAARDCSSCKDAIAEVDALPFPERGPLSFATIDRVTSRATRAALDAARRDPEDGPRKFAEHVEPLYARDCARQDPDAWARHGAVLGAKAGWSGEAASSMPMLPPDCPRGAAARCYVGAWSFAAGVVMQICMEVGHG